MGGTENTVRAQARALVARGHEVVVVAGSMQWEDGFRVSQATDTDPESGVSYPIHRIHRDDHYFDHWHKSASPRVSAAFRNILLEERPDVIHVQHWIRLSRDLVAVAARLKIPAVITLHDLWTTCLLTFRLRPNQVGLCEKPLAISPCIACAAEVPPKTPWVTFEAGAIALSERLSDVRRELDLARAIVTPSRAHATAIEGFLGLNAGALESHVIPPGRNIEASAGLDSRANRTIESQSASGRLVLGAWGHLDPIKGLDVVLEAIRKLKDPSKVTLHVAGQEVNPDFAAKVHALAEGLDVHFHGTFEVQELASHPVTAVHAMVSGSRAHESWGLVLDEAWQLGLPAILPNRGAFVERLEAHKAGVLYESSSSDDLAAVIERLLADARILDELRAGIPDHDQISPNLEQMVNQLESVYNVALEAGPPTPPGDESLVDLVRARALQEWDKSLQRRTPTELGFE
ncbi:MAG: glycosyltransferase involved in cell wall biosynthesis [Planctomycetota bacterium]|jgi:glycosyltransferase involved in cell wall biosynthesis